MLLIIVAPADSMSVRSVVRVLSCSASTLAQKVDQGRPNVAFLREDLVVRN